MNSMLYPVMSKQVVDSFFEVHKALGPGLLESCYHNALYYSLKKNLTVVYNKPYTVLFEGHTVGEYFADLVVESSVIVEVKSCAVLCGNHAAQLLNYLHISGCRLGFLVNFQNCNLEFKRFVV